MTTEKLGKRMAKEGIPEYYAKDLIQQSNGNINALKELIKSYLISIDAENIDQSIKKIFK